MTITAWRRDNTTAGRRRDNTLAGRRRDNTLAGRRRRAVAVAVLLAVTSAAACSSVVAGSAEPSARVSRSPQGAPVLQLPDVVSAAAGLDVSGILADLQEFWAQQRVAGVPAFTAPAGGYSLVDSAAAGADSAALCAGSAGALLGNAFYCPAQKGIVIDGAALVPVVSGHYGVGGLAAAIAHEYGHAMQAEIGDGRQDSDGQQSHILVEAQADCAAGAFLGWASDGKAARLRLSRNDLATAIGPLVDFRDSPADAGAAHGLGLDRLRFVLRGLAAGAPACLAMTTADLNLTLGRGTATPAVARFSGDDSLVAAARRSVADFAPGTDTSAAVDQHAYALAARYGQFAQATIVALAIGRARYPDGDAAMCFTGAWAAATFRPGNVAALGGWPGDADEAMDAVRSVPGTGPDQLVAFVDGFESGAARCG